MSDELESVDGVSRRSMLKKSALVGGTMVWAAPVVQSITSPAFGQDATPSPEGETQDISFVAVLLRCGDDVYRVKWELGESGVFRECGTTFRVDGCANQLIDPATTQSGCPTGVGTTATINSDGSWTVDLGTCTLIDYVVKCGAKAYDSEGRGCQDFPEEVRTPPAGSTGPTTFHPCSTAAPTGS